MAAGKAASNGASSSASALATSGSSRWEPQVAVLCDPGQGYHPQHLADDGRWTADLTAKPPRGSACLRDKMDILEHCKKVYPNRDITNIVESSHYLKVSGWCRLGATNQAKCKAARWVKPFRCLEGPFQSDALLVPEGCLFDHIHNQSHCWQFSRWNQTGARACSERGLQLRSFAMLLPCGISLFSGVEFVCCPKHYKDNSRVKKIDLPAMKDSDLIPIPDDLDDATSMDDEEDDDDEEGDAEDDYDSEEDSESDPSSDQTDSSDLNQNPPLSPDWPDSPSQQTPSLSNSFTSTQAAVTPSPAPTTAQQAVTQQQQSVTQPPQMVTSTQAPPSAQTPDPYFTHFDPRVEHQNYKEAQQRLEETHREKVTKVMKDWSDLEERYQDMRLADPRAAQGFKRRMTARFQASVQALEEQGEAEKRQLAAMHQQRVLAHINQRRKEAMACYTQALTDQPPNTHRVQKCLQKLLRALHKDRAHALAHYRHLLASATTGNGGRNGGSAAGGGLEAAANERPRTLERLVDIDRAVNQSMQMLRRYPELADKIGQLMDDYIQALRSKDETPGSMLAMTEDAEIAILDKYRTEVERKLAEKERQRLFEKQRKEQRSRARAELRQEKMRSEAARHELTAKSAVTEEQTPDKEEMEPKDLEEEEDQRDSDESEVKVVSSSTQRPLVAAQHNSGVVDDAAVQRAVEQVALQRQTEARASHAMTHDLGHGEPGYSLRTHDLFTPSGRLGEGRSVYFTLAFAGVALAAAVVVGVAVAKRRAARSPGAQGFVEVDQGCGTVPVPVTPEERHVANMQVNGYENPTYKYFEVKE
ncbi:amyloid-beta-like protein [Ctenocephalides felis]|uniref:amyloid-beta-like protein n=1 Tax=Ctenocephalides felis TaxID=7515 RepID=UPI000E6E1CC3|nr:amyloid-beta-like protein [Ctenocephalides felis]